MTPRTVMFIFVLLVAVGLSLPHAVADTDEEIRQTLIQQSLAHYPGNCPCPYNADQAGRRCGGRSAYIRAGGYSPLCYPQDVAQDMVNQYKATRSRHGQ